MHAQNKTRRILSLLSLGALAITLSACADPIEGDWRLDRISGAESCGVTGNLEIEAESGDFDARVTCGNDAFTMDAVITDLDVKKAGEDYELDVQFFTGSSPLLQWDCELRADGEELRCEEDLNGYRTTYDFERD